MTSINWKRTGGAIILVAGLCALLAGCSSSPSSGDGERAIQDRINEQSQGRIKLTKFNKSDAVQGEVMGVRFYSLEFDAEIEFTEDCKWVVGMFGQQLSFQTSKPVAKPGSGFSWNSFLDDTVSNPGTLVKKGQQVKLSGAIRFVKKERGWSVEGVELKKADVGNVPQSAAETPPGRQTPIATAETQKKPTRPAPAQADKEVLDALADVEREYPIDSTPLPGSGDLASVFHLGGIRTIRFIEPDFRQGKIYALIEEHIYGASGSTNLLSLNGNIYGGKLILRGKNDPDAALELILQQSYRSISGQFKSGQSAGTATINLGDSNLRDSDPKTDDSLTWIRFRGKDVFKAATFTGNTYHFPSASPLRDSRYVYIPSMVMPLNDFPKDKRILLFQKPSASFRVIPIFCLDEVVRKISLEDLEKRIKEQTGKSVGQLAEEDATAKEKATSARWTEFDGVASTTPKTQQAVDFSLRGVKLGARLSELKEQLPNVQPWMNTNNAEAEGWWRFTREQGLPEAKQVAFALRGGRVSRMWITYSLEDVDKLGGWQSIVDGLKYKFGEPDSDSTGIQEKNGQSRVNFRWKIADVQRSFGFGYTSGEKGIASVSTEALTFSDAARPAK